VVTAIPVCLLCLQKPDAVETAVKEAEEKCASGSTGECAAAWDNVSGLSRAQQQKTLCRYSQAPLVFFSQVEEISAAISHKKVAEVSLWGQQVRYMQGTVGVWALRAAEPACSFTTPCLEGADACNAGVAVHGLPTVAMSMLSLIAASTARTPCAIDLPETTHPLSIHVQADHSDPLEKFCDDNPDADECRYAYRHAGRLPRERRKSYVSRSALGAGRMFTCPGMS
jgi:hypothetical protein